jgi:hypothetical protein
MDHCYLCTMPRFSHSIAWLLWALTSIKTLLVPMVYVDFELRKSYIIQNLCENRFKPELHCNGKCYLAKTLHQIAEEKAEDETQRQGQNMKKILEEVFEVRTFSWPLSQDWQAKNFSVFFYQLGKNTTFHPALLRPPALAIG